VAVGRCVPSPQGVTDDAVARSVGDRPTLGGRRNGQRNSRDALVGYINAERHLGVPADGDPYVEGS